MSEAQKRATAAWRERHSLKRVELLVPENTLVSIDDQAGEQGLSRSRFILEAVERAIGAVKPSTDEGRLVQLSRPSWMAC